MELKQNYQASQNLFEDLKRRNLTGTVVVDLNDNGSVKNWVVVTGEGVAESKPGAGERLVYPGAEINCQKIRARHEKEVSKLKKELLASWITAGAAIVAMIFALI